MGWSDAYDAKYYAKSPEHNPQGPLTGKEKVLRGVEANEGDARNIRAMGPVTVKRWHKIPNPPLINDNARINQNGYTSARCVANHPKPLN